MLTIFGYSAPKTDVKAMEALKVGWGRAAERELEEIEIINLAAEDELARTWSDFINSHHYRCRTNFFDSWLAKHPQRSCDAMWNQTMECKFVVDNATPRATTMEELWEWYAPLLEGERSSPQGINERHPRSSGSRRPREVRQASTSSTSPPAAVAEATVKTAHLAVQP
jgi:hypothetical protein